MPSNPTQLIQSGPVNTTTVGQPSRRRWALLAILSLVLPPVGLALAIYYFIKWRRRRQKLQLLLAAATIAAALVGTTGYLLVYPSIYETRFGRYTYSNSNLQEYKLPGPLDNTAITFAKPPEFAKVGQKVQTGTAGVAFVHYSDQTNPKTALGYLKVVSLQSALAGSDSYVKEVNQLLQAQKGQAYDDYLASLADFVRQSLPADYKISLGSPRTINNGNLSKNAWSFDFTAQNTNQSVKRFTIQGKLVFAIGKSTFYYLMISTLAYNWQPSQATWDKLVDTIEIDQ